MKISDISVGDIVLVGMHCGYNGFDFVPQKITLGDFNFWYTNGWSDTDFDEFVKPTRLTTDFLEKNGFSKTLSNDGKHYIYEIFSDGIEFGMRYANGVFQWLGPLDIIYVHELQKALKLIGMENVELNF